MNAASNTREQKSALLVEYEKLTPAGVPTGIETSVLTKLTTRGFPLLSYGTTESQDPSIAYLTMLLGACDEHRLTNAVTQVSNIIGVMRAELRDLRLVTQDLHARANGLTGDEMRTLRKDYGVNIHRTAVFPAILERSARSKTRTISRAEAKITKVSRERISPDQKELHERQVNLKVRIKNPNPKVSATVESIGGTFRELDILELNADVSHIDAAIRYLRTEIAAKVSDLYVTAPRTTIKKSEGNEPRIAGSASRL